MSLHEVIVLVSDVSVPAGFGVLAVRTVSSVLSYRLKREIFRLYHVERMAAIDKGVSLPALPPGFFQDSRSTERGKQGGG